MPSTTWFPAARAMTLHDVVLSVYSRSPLCFYANGTSAIRKIHPGSHML